MTVVYLLNVGVAQFNLNGLLILNSILTIKHCVDIINSGKELVHLIINHFYRTVDYFPTEFVGVNDLLLLVVEKLLIIHWTERTVEPFSPVLQFLIELLEQFHKIDQLFSEHVIFDQVLGRVFADFWAFGG